MQALMLMLQINHCKQEFIQYSKYLPSFQSLIFSKFISEAFVDPAGESDENGMDGINIVNLEDSSLQEAEPEQERECFHYSWQIIIKK